MCWIGCRNEKRGGRPDSKGKCDFRNRERPTYCKDYKPKEKQMQTVDIKGKSYVMVNERIKYFREHYPDHALLSEIVELTDARCVIKATVLDGKDRPIANGLAYEMHDSTFINKTSFVENCETSAWGRALGNLGIGIDTSIASSEEVQNAIKNQAKPQPFKGHRGGQDRPPAGVKLSGEKRSATTAQMDHLRVMFRNAGIVNEEAAKFIAWIERSEPLTEASAREFIEQFDQYHSAYTKSQMEEDIPV